MPIEPLPCTPEGPGPGPGPGPGGSSCCAPSITSTALCRPDGTTILLVLRSGCVCDGADPGTPEVAGWIDAGTGEFTEGPAPGDAGPCSGSGSDDCATVTVLRLCDQTDDCTPFLRHLLHDCTGTVTSSADTTEDGTTPYTPAGAVGDCAACTDCPPTPMCGQLLGLSGPETWSMPEGTESLTINVACGPVTITDCAGNTTVVAECGTGFTWGAPPTPGCAPPALCMPFTVDIPEGAAAYLNFVSPCADES